MKSEHILYSLLILLFLAKSFLLVFTNPPFDPETELAHYGYIEALARTNAWYLIDENTPSNEAISAFNLLQTKSLATAVTSISAGSFQSERLVPSTHVNDTRSQPPLYYWLMAKVYQLFRHANLLTLIYLYRSLNVILATLTLILATFFSQKLFLKPLERFMFVGFLVFHPLYSFVSTQITNHILLIFLSTILLYGLYSAYRHRYPWISLILIFASLILGLLTQQIFLLFVPLIITSLLACLIYHRLPLHRFLFSLLILFTLLLSVYPQYLARYHATQNVVSTDLTRQSYSPTQFMLYELPRLKNEFFTGFWDQGQGTIPYHSNPSLLNLNRFWTLLTLFGLVYGLYHRLFAPSKTYWLILSLSGIGLFTGFLLYFDYFNITGGSFKTYFLLPLLIPIASLATFGLSTLFNKQRYFPLLALTFICFYLLLNVSAFGHFLIVLGLSI